MRNETQKILPKNQVSISDITSIKNEELKQNFQTFAHKDLCCIKHNDYAVVQYGTLTMMKN